MKKTLSNLLFFKLSMCRLDVRCGLAYGLLLMVSNATGASAAEPPDAAIYRDVLQIILKNDKPKTFAVWEQQIDAATMEAVRVPRHDPYQQFSRSLKGLDRALEAELLTPDGEAGAGKKLPAFAMPPSLPVPATFSGFFGLDAIRLAQANAKPNDFNGWPLLVGFSKVAYGDHGRSALLYAETCLLGPGGDCGGEAYWFIQSKAGWQLKRHASLWDGSLRPLWDIQGATPAQAR